MMRLLIVNIMLFLSTTILLGQSTDSLKQKAFFRALPVVYFTPETSLALEAFGFLKFYTKGARRASNVRLFAAYTLNDQVLIDLPWQIFTANEHYRLIGKFEHRLFPEYFFGLGNATTSTDRILYTYESTALNATFQKHIKTDLFLGAHFEMRKLDTELPIMEFYQSEMYDVVGSKGYNYLGAGPVLSFDGRDAILYPTRGVFFETGLLVNRGNEPHGRIGFSKFSLDARKYHPVDDKSVLAFQFYTVATFGQVPYREMPALGGPLLHRGYYFGRFRDQHAFLTQAEFRRHLFWRLGFTTFASVGRVFADFEEVVFAGLNPAGGLGLRFKVGKNDNTNLRLDLALTKDSYGFYLYFAEAF